MDNYSVAALLRPHPELTDKCNEVLDRERGRLVRCSIPITKYVFETIGSTGDRRVESWKIQCRSNLCQSCEINRELILRTKFIERFASWRALGLECLFLTTTFPPLFREVRLDSVADFDRYRQEAELRRVVLELFTDRLRESATLSNVVGYCFSEEKNFSARKFRRINGHTKMISGDMLNLHFHFGIFVHELPDCSANLELELSAFFTCTGISVTSLPVKNLK